MTRKYIDVNINAKYTDLDHSGRELLFQKRKALADEVLQRFADAGLTVETALDILTTAQNELQVAINSCSVTLVCKHHLSRQDSHTPPGTPRT